jgi:hypothetical protein
MTDTVSPTPAESEPDPFTAIAHELHRIADDLASLAGSGLPKPSWVSFDMHAGSHAIQRDDNLTAFAVDTVGRALLNKPGEIHKMVGGSYHYGTDPTSRGPIKVHVYDSVDTAWALEREGANELAKRDVEIKRLEAELAVLKRDREHDIAERLVAEARPGYLPGGLDFDRSDVADDPTPVSPARVEPHWGGLAGPLDGGQLVTYDEAACKGCGGNVRLFGLDLYHVNERGERLLVESHSAWTGA